MLFERMHPCKSIISSFPHKSIWLCENIIPCFLACLVLQVPKSVAMKGKYSVQVIQDLDLPRHDAATIGQLSRSRIVSKAGRGAPEPSCPNCWLSAVVSGPSTETRNLYRSSGNHLTSFLLATMLSFRSLTRPHCVPFPLRTRNYYSLMLLIGVSRPKFFASGLYSRVIDLFRT